jgi:ankyrin repeat protein
MDSLAKKHSRRDVRKALENLPKELDGTYDEAMQRIGSQDEDDAKLAEKVLSWISYAFRPLTIIEVRHALAAESGDEDFDEEALLDEDVLVSVCAGLVTIDQESNIIRLVHYTTQEYFERIRMNRFPDAQACIATACLAYISFDVFAEGYCRSDEEMETRMQKYPFLEYAAQHWGDHARGDLEVVIKERALNFLKQESKVMCSCQVIHLPEYRFSGYSQCLPEHLTGLHLAASFGLTKIVRLLLEREGVDADSKDSDGGTPLSRAAFNGHEAVVRLLLEKGADITAKDGRGVTALHLAAATGHEAVMRLLLQKGTDVAAKDGRGVTALHLAAANGHEAMVRLLVERGADVAAKDIDGWTALHFAGYGGHWAAMLLLLEKGADITAKDDRGEIPLLSAAATGHEVVVRLLLLYCREHGMAIYDEDMDVAAKLLAGPKSHMICDGCDARIADSDPHHHCSICNDDYFDLCQKCIDSGVLCPGNGHRLIKRRIENGELIYI